jgi:fumarate reductase subunit C
VAARRPYERSNAGWWRKNPVFKRYLAREATCLAVALYALILLAGLVQLARGAAPFEAWLAALRSPLSLLLHAVLLAAFAYHTYSWFEIMPKTLPPIAVGGRTVPAWAITAGGIAAALACSIALIAGIAWLAR